MARATGKPAPVRVVNLSLAREDAELLEVAVAALGVAPDEVLRRGLYLIGLTGQTLLGTSRVRMAGNRMELARR